MDSRNFFKDLSIFIISNLAQLSGSYNLVSRRISELQFPRLNHSPSIRDKNEAKEIQMCFKLINCPSNASNYYLANSF